MDSGNTWKNTPMALTCCCLLDVEGKEEKESKMLLRFLDYISWGILIIILAK